MGEITFRGRKIKYDDAGKDFWSSLPDSNWEKETFDILEKYLGEGKTFLDVGAWNGVLSIYASMLGAKVYAIEPDPEAFVQLEDNVQMNAADVSTHRLAIWDLDSGVQLKNVPGQFGNSMSSLLHRYDKETVVNVKGQRLDSFISDHNIVPDLIKIDVEGAEKFIVPSSLEVFAKLDCPLLISIHPQWLPPDLFHVLLVTLDQVYPRFQEIGSDQILFTKN